MDTNSTEQPVPLQDQRAPKVDDLDIASDRLNGAEAIAAFRGEPVFRTRYLIRKGLLPVAREGERIIGSKRVLREHYLTAVSGKRGAA